MPTWRWPAPSSSSRSCSGASSIPWPTGKAGLAQVSWSDLTPLVGAWIGFGLFIIVASTIVALHADRLAHRHRQKVRTDYFEHVLQLPLNYHTGTHSGRLVKIMLTGTTTLWSLWLSFFRDHLTSFVSLIVLMPMTLFINWRFGLLLIALCVVFAVLIAFVLHHTEKLQGRLKATIPTWPSVPATRWAISR